MRTLKSVTSVCATLAIISGCCGPQTIAPFDAPSRPEIVGLSQAEIDSLPESVLSKFDHNLLEVREYVLRVEARVRIANGQND